LNAPHERTVWVSFLAADLDGKRQEILIEAVPGLRRIAALADSNTTAQSRHTGRTRTRLRLSVHRIVKAEEIPAALDASKASGAEALKKACGGNS
jgi:putative tryptophan/tyrosine transport system substrate-binding protein